MGRRYPARMRTEISYSPAFAMATLHLDDGESVNAEAGAMMAMSPAVEIETSTMGGVLKGLRRSVLGGESFFMSTWTIWPSRMTRSHATLGRSPTAHTRPTAPSMTAACAASARPENMCFVPRQQYRDQLAEDWDHHRYAICHYVVFPNTVFNCNPEHIQVFQPIPIDVDRTRFLCWELVYPGDDDDPEYVEYRERMLRHWEHLKVVVGEDIDIYQQLARTKRSSAYTENILSSREFKIAHYHEKMAEMVRG